MYYNVTKLSTGVFKFALFMLLTMTATHAGMTKLLFEENFDSSILGRFFGNYYLHDPSDGNLLVFDDGSVVALSRANTMEQTYLASASMIPRFNPNNSLTFNLEIDEISPPDNDSFVREGPEVRAFFGVVDNHPLAFAVPKNNLHAKRAAILTIEADYKKSAGNVILDSISLILSVKDQAEYGPLNSSNDVVGRWKLKNIPHFPLNVQFTLDQNAWSVNVPGASLEGGRTTQAHIFGKDWVNLPYPIIGGENSDGSHYGAYGAMRFKSLSVREGSAITGTEVLLGEAFTRYFLERNFNRSLSGWVRDYRQNEALLFSNKIPNEVQDQIYSKHPLTLSEGNRLNYRVKVKSLKPPENKHLNGKVRSYFGFVTDTGEIDDFASDDNRTNEAFRLLPYFSKDAVLLTMEGDFDPDSQNLTNVALVLSVKNNARMSPVNSIESVLGYWNVERVPSFPITVELSMTANNLSVQAWDKFGYELTLQGDSQVLPHKISDRLLQSHAVLGAESVGESFGVTIIDSLAISEISSTKLQPKLKFQSAEQSDTIGRDYAYLAIDGNRDTNTRTFDSAYFPWWQGDLGSTYYIDAIDLYNFYRDELYGHNLYGAYVIITEEKQDWRNMSNQMRQEYMLKHGTQIASDTLSVSFLEPKYGRYVSIMRTNSRKLYLGEVEVQGSIRGEMQIVCDDEYELFVNGKRYTGKYNKIWSYADMISDIKLTDNKINIIDIVATNKAGGGLLWFEIYHDGQIYSSSSENCQVIEENGFIVDSYPPIELGRTLDLYNDVRNFAPKSNDTRWLKLPNVNDSPFGDSRAETITVRYALDLR